MFTQLFISKNLIISLLILFSFFLFSDLIVHQTNAWLIARTVSTASCGMTTPSFTPTPTPISTSSIIVNAYKCPFGTPIDESYRPDQDGNSPSAPPGCIPFVSSKAGYILEDIDNLDPPYPNMFDLSAYDHVEPSDDFGVVTINDLNTSQRYNLGIYDNNAIVNDPLMIAFLCFNNSTPISDNHEVIILDPSYVTYCNAYAITF